MGVGWGSRLESGIEIFVMTVQTGRSGWDWVGYDGVWYWACGSRGSSPRGAVSAKFFTTVHCVKLMFSPFVVG